MNQIITDALDPKNFTLALLLGLVAPSFAETPEQVQQRLEQYRLHDEAEAQRKAEQEAEAEQRRKQTREWQEQRRREDYARRWKCYGAEEVDVLLWRPQKDGTWVTSSKDATGNIPCIRNRSNEVDLPLLLQRQFSGLPATTDRLWVKVRNPISIEELADKLAQDETKLAKLNDVNEDHQFTSGDWLVLPSQSSKKMRQLIAIDTSDLRRTPPLAAPPEPQEAPRIRFGDSLAKIASRYNLSIGELLRLNPGLQAARLVVGTQIRVANSYPGRNRMVLGLKPSVSGGLSWPDQPDFNSNRKQKFLNPYAGLSPASLVGVNCASLMINRKPAYEEWGIWVRPAKNSSDEQLVIERCASPNTASSSGTSW